jgi:hypothetical protein
VPPPATELDDAPAGVQDLFAQAEAGAITYEEAYETAEEDFEWTSEAHDEAGEYGDGEYGDVVAEVGGEYGDVEDEDEDEDWGDEDEDEDEEEEEDEDKLA